MQIQRMRKRRKSRFINRATEVRKVSVVDKARLMEKLAFVLFVFGLCSVHSSENFHHDNLVPSVVGTQYSEADLPSRGSEKQVADVFNDFSLLTFRWFHSLPQNSECRIHMNQIHQEAAGLSFWALKFLDASAKIPSGILSGNLNQFGDFDQCLSAVGHIDNATIQGKYCLANVGIKFDRKQVSKEIKKIDSAIHSNWILHNEFRDQGHRIPKFETFNIGVCVPASCSPNEIETAFSDRLKKLSKTHFVEFQISVSDEVCYISIQNQFSLFKVIVWLLFSFVVVLTLLGTLVDANKFKITNQTFVRVLVCFSLKRNWALLLKTSSPPDDINCIHGARFLNAIALLLSHKQIAMLFSPILNRTSMSESFSKGWTMIGRAAILYTDSFILFSGLLISYSTVKDLDKKKITNFKEKLINRIVRLLPNLIGVILFCTYIMDDMGSGPQWGLVVSKYTNLCKKYMWRNFLFVHNYFGFENMCLTHTHQLGIDMQLFLMSPIFIYVIWKKPKLGSLLLAIVAGSSTWLRFEITQRKNLSTLLYYGISVERLWKTANNSYILPTHRLTVYLIGIVLGYYMRRGGQNLNFTKTRATVGWTLAVASGLLAVYGPYQAAFKDYEYNVKDAARFNAFAPILWAVFLTWSLLACSNGYGGLFNKFLTWKYFTIFTRISYAVYLTQFPVFFYNVGTERTPQYFKGFHSLFDLEELGIIFTASVVLTLIIDIPFQELKKAITSTKNTMDTQDVPNTTENSQTIRPNNGIYRRRKRLQFFGT